MPDAMTTQTITFTDPHALAQVVSTFKDSKAITAISFKTEINKSISTDSSPAIAKQFNEKDWLAKVTNALSQIPTQVTSVSFKGCNLDQLTDIPALLNAIPQHVTRINISNNNLGSYCENNEKTQALLQSLGRFKGVHLATNNLDKIPANVSLQWPADKQTTFIDLSDNNLASIGDRLEQILESIGLINALWLAKNNFLTLEHSQNLANALAKTNFSDNARLNLGMNTFSEDKLNAFITIFTALNSKSISALELYRVGLNEFNFAELCQFFASVPKPLSSLSIGYNQLNAKILSSQASREQAELKDGFQIAIENLSKEITRVNMAGNNLLPKRNRNEMMKYIAGLPESITEGSFDEHSTELQFKPIDKRLAIEAQQKALKNALSNTDPTSQPGQNRQTLFGASAANALAQDPDLTAVQKKYVDTAEAYIKYTKENCYWSILRWHGETGRDNARSMINRIKKAKTVEAVDTIVNDNINGIYGGRKNAHSLRTMFLATQLSIPLTMNDLKKLSKTFDEKKQAGKNTLSF